jgi:hypothetical protein
VKDGSWPETWTEPTDEEIAAFEREYDERIEGRRKYQERPDVDDGPEV